MELKFEITPERQGHESEDQWTTICVSASSNAAAPMTPKTTHVAIDLRDDGPAGSGRSLALLDLSLTEALELASVLKILSNPDGPHSTEDLVRVGLPVT